ncbi:ABC transporter substrate-binding protein [Paracoccus suum]|uniref:ABC transporter substrate-binding protein n=1 Tax=Paracoccus suum TaxID=2259340 RepID=A0A344PLH5_9RHOB|nr:ABC transporter substrate-binding protein [Paracoccus suum]AXC50230.1 ABC transporter substrate-binding protein [Paracoccus suum]
MEDISVLRAILTTVASFALANMATAEENTINFRSWGGAYSAAQKQAYVQRFQEATGIKVNMIDVDNPATPIKAEVEAGNVMTDAATVEYADAISLCDQGLLEPMDMAIFAPGADGTPPEKDFLEGTISDCFVASDVSATIIGYDTTKFPNGEPSTVADFFDLEKYPGKRGLRKSPKVNLELALMADGVPPADVYATLETPEGIDRAFRKLDTIKPSAVWWEAGAQPPQLLADGEVTMTTSYNGRIFDAMINEAKPFKIIWQGEVYEFEGIVIPKGAPNVELAKKFINFATEPQSMANLTRYISYGPTRKSAAALVTTYKDDKTEMMPNLPTSEVNLKEALPSSNEFWADHDSELTERFNSWLAG